MSRRKQKTDRKRQEERDLSVRAVRRPVPDKKKLSRAFIGLAMARAAAEAEAQSSAIPARKPRPIDQPIGEGDDARRS